MFIARIITYIALTIFTISCTSNRVTSKDSCEMTKASFDIGSGSTKMVVADIDICKGEIINILFEASRAIPLKDHLLGNKNKFSKSFIYNSIDQIAELKKRAINKGATSFNAVATAAFRAATNSNEFKSALKQRLNLSVLVINQTTEALTAFKSAKSIVKKDNLLVWDIGGGSMQIIKSENGKKNIYLGKLASVTFKDEIMSLLEKKKTPNPLGKAGAILAMEKARRYANEHAKEILGEIEDQYVIGVGGVHFYSIKNQTRTEDFYSQKDVLNTLIERSKLTDQEIGGEFASTDVTNLALVLGFMQALGIERVYPIKINMAHGILLSH